jgi:hypothetical protein
MATLLRSTIIDLLLYHDNDLNLFPLYSDAIRSHCIYWLTWPPFASVEGPGSYLITLQSHSREYIDELTTIPILTTCSGDRSASRHSRSPLQTQPSIWVDLELSTWHRRSARSDRSLTEPASAREVSLLGTRFTNRLCPVTYLRRTEYM